MSRGDIVYITAVIIAAAVAIIGLYRDEPMVLCAACILAILFAMMSYQAIAGRRVRKFIPVISCLALMVSVASCFIEASSVIIYLMVAASYTAAGGVITVELIGFSGVRLDRVLLPIFTTLFQMAVITFGSILYGVMRFDDLNKGLVENDAVIQGFLVAVPITIVTVIIVYLILRRRDIKIIISETVLEAAK